MRRHIPSRDKVIGDHIDNDKVIGNDELIGNDKVRVRAEQGRGPQPDAQPTARHRGVRSYLLLVGLLPLVAMVLIVVSTAQHSVEDYRSADAYAAASDSAARLAAFEDAVRSESVLALDVTTVSATDVRETSETFNERVVQTLDNDTSNRFLAAARATDQLLAQLEAAGDLGSDAIARVDRLTETRTRIRVLLTSPAEVDLFYQRLVGDIRAGLQAQLDLVARDAGPTVRSAVNREAVVRNLAEATGNLQRELTYTIGRLLVGGQGDWDDLATAAGRARLAETTLRRSLTPALAAEWEALSAPLLGALTAVEALAMQAPSLAGPSLVDTTVELAEIRSTLLTSTAAQSDLLNMLSAEISGIADSQRTSALWSLALSIGLVVMTALMFAVAATLIGRAIVGPLQRAADAANLVNRGQLSNLEATDQGPAEVREVSRALSDLIETIAVIERQSVAMASGDLTDPALAERLPGDLGQSLESSIAMWRDTTHEAQVTNALNAAISDATSDAQLLCDADLAVIEANPAAGTLFGESASKLIGLRLDRLLAPDDIGAISATFAQSGTFSGEAVATARRGSVPVMVTATRVTSGERELHSVLMRDISDRQDLLDRLSREIRFDSLTDLASRKRFVESLADATGRGSTGMVLLDLDNFKGVNDTYGQSAGDEILALLARRLEMAVGEGRLVARMGSDEFAVLVPGAINMTEVKAVAEKLHEVLSQPFELRHAQLSLTASIGFSFTTDGDTDADALLHNTIVAHRHAKVHGGNTIVAYDDQLIAALAQRNQIISELELALSDDSLELWYQPVVDAGQNRVTSAEALLRWRLPDGSMRPPGVFIPLAEESDLILQVDRWVIGQCCRQLNAWANTDLADVRVSVNVSGRHLNEGDLVETIVQACTTWNVEPGRLAVEITESYLATDLERSKGILQELHEFGVKLYIDDFGTGYSSLAYLQDLPFDVLKIDRAFVNRLGTSETSDSITQALVMLGETMSLDVLAEGVETRAQLDTLHNFGCRQFQGFHLCRPVPAEEFASYATGAPPLGDHARKRLHVAS